MGTCTDPWNLFSSEQVMVTILVTLVLLNLYLVLHYNVGSGLTRVFFFTVKLFSSVLVCSVFVTTNSSVLVFSILVTTNSTNLYLALRYNLGSGLTRVFCSQQW